MDPKKQSDTQCPKSVEHENDLSFVIKDVQSEHTIEGSDQHVTVQ